jgi:hypothetical protein
MAKWTYLSFFYSWLVVHLAITLSVFILFVACGSFGHCIICLSSIHELWFIWPLYYLSKSWIEERQIIQWPNEPQSTNRLKTDNAMAKWLVIHLAIALSVFLLFMTCGSFYHCIICFSSIYDLWFIRPLYYLSFFYSWLVVHLAIVLSVFILFVACGLFRHCIICLSSIHRRKTDNTMAKWPTSHE